MLDGRYHHHLLRTPQEVRQTLAYVLLAGRRESRARPLDPASSARWFDGWRPEVASRFGAAQGDPEVARARTWLLKTGWRRHGLVDSGEVPRLDEASLPPS